MARGPKRCCCGIRSPVVVATADVSLAERAACLASGANAVLPKPFRASDLKACLRANVPALRAA